MAIPSPVPDVGDVLEAKAYVTNQDQTAIMTWHFRVSLVAGAGKTLKQIAGFIKDATLLDLGPLMGSDSFLKEVGVRTIAPGKTTEFFTTGAPVAGSDPGDTLPKQASGIISWYTQVPGPGGRGRTYVPFPTTSFLTGNGDCDASYPPALNDLADALLATQTWGVAPDFVVGHLVLWHRALNSSSDIQAYASRQKFATQKRRGEYGRANAAP